MEEKNTPLLVDIGGRLLAVRTEGEGVPTVVLEMGLGAAGSIYDAIAKQIAYFTRAVWYDRAGLGLSDPASTPRTIQDLARDLHFLLQKTGIPGPYVLAGHSLGGPVVRFYRERYPDEVAALILIDSSHEDQRERCLALLPPKSSDEAGNLAQLRLALERQWKDPNANEEKIDNLANSQLLRTCQSLDDLPVTVVSRGRSAQDPTKYPPGLVEAMEQAWRQMQCELARLSPKTQHVIATRSGHMINKDEPEVIVEAIRQMVIQVREQCKL
ncbi:alpha/beta hydrolase [Ktedonosporobacter rubrisoli]|uniref:Alpha/beta hydrolase n=1 Tax=Ktedonosporobacter rubrisoli TaxID=2509675 RepID=A0A4P6JI98_KTERU|nr:alpha/beta hydrolase [Ktedonosporobacter rubrisoli]QBD74778.1 alpha/beta hydrolase [Ktedonosporobacter rubrisoli]